MYLSPVAHRPGHDELFASMAKELMWKDTEVHVTCLPKAAGNFTNVEFRSFEAMVTPYIIRGVRAAANEGFDACVIGCFYDTALADAKEISGDMIVTAPCVASCDIAASLANRFGIIVGRQKWVDQMHQTVRQNGYDNRLTGFYPVGLRVTDFQKDHEATGQKLLTAARKAVDEDGAEALILGCTMEIGFHKVLQREVGVPVIDPATAAFERAQYLAHLKATSDWHPSRKHSCEAPPKHEIQKMKFFDSRESYGNRIVLSSQPNQQETNDVQSKTQGHVSQPRRHIAL